MALAWPAPLCREPCAATADKRGFEVTELPVDPARADEREATSALCSPSITASGSGISASMSKPFAEVPETDFARALSDTERRAAASLPTNFPTESFRKDVIVANEDTFPSLPGLMINEEFEDDDPCSKEDAFADDWFEASVDEEFCDAFVVFDVSLWQELQGARTEAADALPEMFVAFAGDNEFDDDETSAGSSLLKKADELVWTKEVGSDDAFADDAFDVTLLFNAEEFVTWTTTSDTGANGDDVFVESDPFAVCAISETLPTAVALVSCNADEAFVCGDDVFCEASVDEEFCDALPEMFVAFADDNEFADDDTSAGSSLLEKNDELVWTKEVGSDDAFADDAFDVTLLFNAEEFVTWTTTSDTGANGDKLPTETTRLSRAMQLPFARSPTMLTPSPAPVH
eukprot:TRINITY_DN1545_c0_g1_i3.p1 TRINITY_DN1545_c0_g1~~TRINITY_DN1545_c0_g1_i3.p1  ORF type:complete len:403 (-),score=89.66 TRINITY_DN1545_c0_g1_i3:193-1401(-)